MAFIELVKSRKSVRNFLDTRVERDKLLSCLEVARLAPSASNSQPWRFVVVDDQKVRNELCKRAFGAIHSFNSFVWTAPVIVAVIFEKSNFFTGIGAMISGTSYHLVDVGIACEHFVLQAEDLGLGSCYIGWFNERGVKSVLKIPRSKKVGLLIALGYYEKEPLVREHKRKPLEEIASFNSF